MEYTSLEEDTLLEDKLAKIKILHRQWKVEEHELFEGNELIGREKQQCKDVGLAIFSFTLQKA